jgi:hypothetical protein
VMNSPPLTQLFPPDSSVDKSVADRAAETIRSASHRISDAIDAGRGPDMPLDILARLDRLLTRRRRRSAALDALSKLFLALMAFGITLLLGALALVIVYPI